MWVNTHFNFNQLLYILMASLNQKRYNCTLYNGDLCLRYFKEGPHRCLPSPHLRCAWACQWKTQRSPFIFQWGSVWINRSWLLRWLKFRPAQLFDRHGLCQTLAADRIFQQSTQTTPHWLSSQHLIWSPLIQPEQSLRLRCSKTPEKNNVPKLMAFEMKTQTKKNIK